MFRVRLPAPRRTVVVALAALTWLATAPAGGVPAAEAADAAGWEPKTPPLTTPWTDDVSPSNAHEKYPRPQLKRQRWRNLNGVWQFAQAASGEAPPYGQDLSERILVPYPVESALSGIMRSDVDRMWYRRTFTVPESWRMGTNGCPHGDDCPRLLLHFEAVDWKAAVYVNGERVSTHKGGYDSFTVDVTAALEYGSNGKPLPEQELIVGVHDPTDRGGQPVGKQREDRGGIFYTGASGIWQTVWMEPVSTAHMTRLEMTPDLSSDTLQLTAHTEGVTDERVVATAYAGGKQVGKVSGPADTELALPVPDPQLWSPKHPYLYDLDVRLVDEHPGEGSGGRPVDKVDSYFGMRSIGLEKIGGKTRITLNGDFVFQTGFLDQGYWPDGIYTPPTDAAMKYDLIQTKRMGFNMVRKHVKVESNRWYYYADKLGLLVWQDMPSMPLRDPKPAAQRQFVDEMHEMVKENESHPSIVTWVPFNEGWGEFEPERVTSLLNSWDPSLLVDTVSGINCCLSFGSGDGDIIDWHTYGYFSSPVATDERAGVIGEYGGLALKVDGHTWAGHGFGHGRVSSAQELTDRYVQYMERAREFMKCCGASAAIYTQTTDVELEINGFLTYDRRVVKPDVQRVREANQAVIEASRQLSGSPPEPEPPVSDLDGAGFWPFDEGSGDVAHDAAGDNDAALVNGPTWTAGRTGSALHFDGQDDYVDTGASILDTSGGYSVSAWVKLDDLNGFQTAVSQDGETNSGFYLQYSDADNRLAFSVIGTRALSDEPPEVGEWYHLVGVRNAYTDTLELYVNGQLAGVESYCLGPPAKGHTVIGRAKFGGNPVDFWHGSIDQVHVYTHPLSADQVSQLYQSGR